MDANGRSSTIILKMNDGTRYEEARAGGAVKPGHLVKLDSAGAVVVHATAAGRAALLVATEEIRVLEGKGKTDAYASGDLVSYRPVSLGDEVQMLLEASHAIAIGDILESAGDGTLQPLSGSFGLFEAMEAIASVASVQWINVRAIRS